MKQVVLVLLIFLGVIFLQGCKKKKPEVTALKHREFKITAAEQARIKKILEAKDGLNLGIFLKVLPANVDGDPDTERIVAYRKKGYERFTVLKPKGNDFVQLKGDAFGGKKYQIVDIRPVNLISPSADSILTVVRGTSLKDLKNKNEIYTHYINRKPKVILNKGEILADAKSRLVLPIDKSVKLTTAFEDIESTFAKEFLIKWQEKEFEKTIDRKVAYEYKGGRSVFLPIKEKVVAEEALIPEAEAIPEKPKKKTKAIINKPVMNKLIKSCEKIFKQVRKQCYDEVFDEKIDPDTDCEKTAKEAQRSCEIG